MPKGWAHRAAKRVAYSCHTHAEKYFINAHFAEKSHPCFKIISCTWNILLVSASISSRKEGEKCAYSASRGSLNISILFVLDFEKIIVIWNYLTLTVCWRCGSPPSHIGPPQGREGGWGGGRRLRRRMCLGGQVASSSSSFNILSLQQEKILPQPTWNGISTTFEAGDLCSDFRKLCFAHFQDSQIKMVRIKDEWGETSWLSLALEVVVQ